MPDKENGIRVSYVFDSISLRRNISIITRINDIPYEQNLPFHSTYLVARLYKGFLQCLLLRENISAIQNRQLSATELSASASLQTAEIPSTTPPLQPTTILSITSLVSYHSIPQSHHHSLLTTVKRYPITSTSNSASAKQTKEKQQRCPPP